MKKKEWRRGEKKRQEIITYSRKPNVPCSCNGSDHGIDTVYSVSILARPLFLVGRIVF